MIILRLLPHVPTSITLSLYLISSLNLQLTESMFQCSKISSLHWEAEWTMFSKSLFLIWMLSIFIFVIPGRALNKSAAYKENLVSIYILSKHSLRFSIFFGIEYLTNFLNAFFLDLGMTQIVKSSTVLK